LEGAYRLKTIVAGGRDFKDWGLMQSSLTKILITEVVSGHAGGADQMGEWYAKVYKLPCKIFPADWETHGKSAGPIRNIEMAKYGDQLVAFWDGKSRGTGHMISYFTKNFPEKPFYVITY